MSDEGYSGRGLQVPAASGVNVAATDGPIGTPLTQPNSASVLTAVRGRVRRIRGDTVEKQRLELLAQQLKELPPAAYIKRQIEIMGR